MENYFVNGAIREAVKKDAARFSAEISDHLLLADRRDAGCCDFFIECLLPKLLGSIFIIVPTSAAYLLFNDYKQARRELSKKREEYAIAREERRELECKLQDLEFRDGKLEALKFPFQEGETRMNLQEQNRSEQALSQRILCEITRLQNNIENTQREVENLTTQKIQLLEDLQEAERVLTKAICDYKILQNMQSSYHADEVVANTETCPCDDCPGVYYNQWSL